MDENESRHTVAREQSRCLARPVADAATTSSDADAPVPKETHPAQGPGDAPPNSPSILWAIAAASEGPRELEIAYRVFSEDAAEMRGDDGVAQGRLEHAIARALLDAWTHGLCSAEAVGSAYAFVGNRVARNSGGGPPHVRTSTRDGDHTEM